jgi:hypothetical protein
MKKTLGALAIITSVLLSGHVYADHHEKKSADYMPTLITETPLEGRMLAITIVRKTIGTVQTDKDAKHRVRKIYAEDPMMLMRTVELVNMEFRIIAEANNYWRK